MNFSAQISPGEVASFSDPDQTFKNAKVQRDHAAESTHQTPQETVFESSLKIKNTIDTFERRAKTAPSLRIMALLLNCEYRLWCLNADTPLRQNPFLTHWVEALQRSSKDAAEKEQGGGAINVIEGNIISKQIFDVRAELIKRLLRNENMNEFSESTPRELLGTCTNRGQRKAFDVEFYVRILEEEGIYEKSHDPPVLARAQEKERPQNKSNSSEWTKNITQKLEEQPDAAIQELTRLPLELPYLDFLTTLLTNHTLESHCIDAAPVITSYIQHALRLTEQMGEAPRSLEEGLIESYGDATRSADHSSIWEYGKEAQSRAVKLLLLFIKNLIRKQLLETQVLYFEIQEICVRYVWIKEVRDFRGWVEEGIDEEQGERFVGGG